MYTINLCKTKAGYEVKLNKRSKLNLTPLTKKFEIVVESPLVVIVKILGEDVIVHNHGTIQFKTELKEKTKVKKIAEIVYSELGLKQKV